MSPLWLHLMERQERDERRKAAGKPPTDDRTYDWIVALIITAVTGGLALLFGFPLWLAVVCAFGALTFFAPIDTNS